MTFTDNYDFENLNDEGKRLVIDELGRQLENASASLCRCNECVVDMAAMALNSLPPRYRSSLLGSIYQADGMNDPSYVVKLEEAVRNAIKRVSRNPGHD
jgi:competence protein ComFB